MEPRGREGTRRARAVTLRQVAVAAGVSASTASRVLAESHRRVDPLLDARVRAAAAELGYTTNLLARAIVSGKSDVIIVFADAPAGPQQQRLTFDIAARLAHAGLVLMLMPVLAETDLVQALRHSHGHRPRGVLLMTGRAEAIDPMVAGEFTAFVEAGTPVIVLREDSETASDLPAGVLTIRSAAGDVVIASVIAECAGGPR